MKKWKKKAKQLGLDTEFDTNKSLKLTSHVLEDDSREIVEEFYIDGNAGEVWITSVERIYKPNKHGDLDVEIIPKPIDKTMLNIAVDFLDDKKINWRED